METEINSLVRCYLDAKTIEEKEASATALVMSIRPELHRYIEAKRPRGSADDVLQITLVAIFSGIPRFRGGSKEFMAWCYAIARNKVNDTFAPKKIELHTYADPEMLRRALHHLETTGDLSAADRHDLEEAIKIIRANDEPCVQYLWSRFVLGMGFQDLGSELGITGEAAMMRVRRCLDLAIKLLKEKAMP